jgi:hypothetical protein
MDDSIPIKMERTRRTVVATTTTPASSNLEEYDSADINNTTKT